MIKLLLLALAGVACACRFDEEHQLARSLPATLILKNGGDRPIDIRDTVSAAGAKGAFVLGSVKLPPHGEVKERITEKALDDIVAGLFTVSVDCGAGRIVQMRGADLAREPLHNIDVWQVTVTVPPPCN